MKTNIEKQFDRIAKEQKEELERIEREYREKERKLKRQFTIYITVVLILAIITGFALIFFS